MIFFDSFFFGTKLRLVWDRELLTVGLIRGRVESVSHFILN